MALTNLQEKLACEDKGARRFVTKLDKEFPNLIDDVKRDHGSNVIVRSLDILFDQWEANAGRRPDGWDNAVKGVIRRQVSLSLDISLSIT